MPTVPSPNIFGRLSAATGVIVLGALLAGTYWQTCLSSRQLSSNFISPATWIWLTAPYQRMSGDGAMGDPVDLPYWLTLGPCFLFALVTWFFGAWFVSRRRQVSWSEAMVLWGWYGGLWWCLLDLWEWVWLISGSTGWASLARLLSVTPQFWFAGCFAGWLTTWLLLIRQPIEPAGSGEKPLWQGWLWLACSVYFITFTAMNWRLYFNLLVPHGDSAMYEEHLWNLLHGKGFRSYLDQGLFLGEHIQVAHLFLLPLYVIWPSHLLLEACSSATLALGAFPVCWMVKRHTGSDRLAMATAAAYLLYFPLQFLDIEIDLKTFRPESLGIPLLLLTLDQLDRQSLVGALVGMLLCLTVKEDYAIIFGPLGLWIALCRPANDDVSHAGPKRVFKNGRFRIAFGLLMSVFSVAYLWLATRVVMPWFRSGVEVHYASYFARFGKTPEEIVRTMVSNPTLLADSLLTTETALYVVALLAPVAFLPLLAPGRLAVGLPLFTILCLNELEGSRSPQHQFHAPLVAIIFWSLASALPVAQRFLAAIGRRFHAKIDEIHFPTEALQRFVWTNALATGLFFSLSPLGISFWDPGSPWNWRLLYGPSKRAAMFARIEPMIPRTARVASTDFVHPRFTHFERSYDYSGYRRKVSGEGKRIPDDTDYLVIDTRHRYSTIKTPEDVPEWREEPEKWDLVPDQTEGYFIVLKRKR